MRRVRRSFNLGNISPNIFKALCALVLALSLVLLVDARLRPAVRAVAVNRAQSLAVRTVGESVESFISENSGQYADMITVTYDSSGKAVSMSLNASEVNLFKSKLIRAVDAALEENSRFNVKIPLGAVTGSEVFAGAGPEIPVTVRMTGSARAEITDEFSSAGINQTRHRVMLHVECSIYVFLGGNEEATVFSDDYCIAENLIVGTVPQTAINIDIPQK